MSKEIDDLRHSIRHIKKSINVLTDLINVLNDKVDIVYNKLKLQDKTKRRRGEYRFKNCIYSVDGYCEEVEHAVDPKTANVNTVKKNGKYYPQITWVDCEICDRYFFRK